MDMIFYDGHCPLCLREIALLRRMERGGLSFIDIHQQPDSSPLAPGRDQLLRRLHLVASDGTWYIGLDATLRAWSHTPAGWLFKPLAWPLVNPVARFLYTQWADRRYRNRYVCDSCTQL